MAASKPKGSARNSRRAERPSSAIRTSTPWLVKARRTRMRVMGSACTQRTRGRSDIESKVRSGRSCGNGSFAARGAGPFQRLARAGEAPGTRVFTILKPSPDGALHLLLRRRVVHLLVAIGEAGLLRHDDAHRGEADDPQEE